MGRVAERPCQHRTVSRVTSIDIEAGKPLKQRGREGVAGGEWTWGSTTGAYNNHCRPLPAGEDQ